MGEARPTLFTCGFGSLWVGGGSKGRGVRTWPDLVGTTSAAAAAEAAITLAAAAATVTAATAAEAAAAAATLRLGGAAGHLLSTLLAFALIIGLLELNLGSLDQALAVLDAREVAEEVLTTVVGLDEAETLLIPAEGHTSRATTAAAAAAAAVAAPTAVAAAIAATVTATVGTAAAAATTTTTTTKVSTVAHLSYRRATRYGEDGGEE